ncbi:MAG: hypothetical protein IKY37_01020 [Bacteroidaceae bacterium]|nr:hypothetical protein [Bacteroidaceae bacterium]
MTYTPKPIDLTGVELDNDLNELREAIAENAHEIWASKRIKEGWSYGPSRDDKKKESPDLVKYSKLPEDEKEYDRRMAMDTLKLIKKLGFDIIKREETPLYHSLLERIHNAKQTFYCPHCQKENGIMTPVYFKQKFCDECGHIVEIDWSLYK